jgi:hypothetical protein
MYTYIVSKERVDTCSPKDRSLTAHKLIKIQRIHPILLKYNVDALKQVGNSETKRTNYIHSSPIVKIKYELGIAK